MEATLAGISFEDDLARRARGGDRGALETLTRRFYPAIRAFLARLVGPRDADDVAQDVFLRLTRGVASYDGQSRFSTWLFRIAINRAYDFARQRRSPVKPLPEPVSEPLISGNENRERLFRAVRTLPPDLAVPLLLVYHEDLSHGRAAEVLGLTPAAVKMRVHRAIRQLRAFLVQEE